MNLSSGYPFWLIRHGLPHDYPVVTANIKEEFAIRKKHGFNVRLLDEKKIQSAYSFSAPAAILSAQRAQTNAYSFTHALLQASIKKGAAIFDRTFIEKITHPSRGLALEYCRSLFISANNCR